MDHKSFALNPLAAEFKPVKARVTTNTRIPADVTKYLERLKLKEKPCACDSTVRDSPWHLLVDCPRFSRFRASLEFQMETKLDKENLPFILEDPRNGQLILKSIKDVLKHRYLNPLAAEFKPMRRKRDTQERIKEYLHMLMLKSRPGCECDRDVTETIWHILFECPRFRRKRAFLQFQLEIDFVKDNLRTILTEMDKRPLFLIFAKEIFLKASERNVTLQSSTPSSTYNNMLMLNNIERPIALSQDPFHLLLRCGEPGSPGLRTRTVALFMDDKTEKIGISFCRNSGDKKVTISPGLAKLLKGSTFKVSIKQKYYEKLPEIRLFGQQCRLLQKKKKIIALFSANENKVKPFTLVCFVLNQLEKVGQDNDTIARKISIDAMVTSYIKGEAADYIGCVNASKYNEIITYEDRGDNLSWLKGKKVKSTATSGSEEMQKRVSEKLQQNKDEVREQKRRKMESLKRIADMAKAFFTAIIPKKSSQRGQAQSYSATKSSFTNSRLPPTRAARGQVNPPQLIKIQTLKDINDNAFLEFQAITKATKQVNLIICKDIMEKFNAGFEGLLREKLHAADATIYNNETSEVLRGEPIRKCMAAYNATNGFVALDEEETAKSGVIKFYTPMSDPIVITAKCTEVMIDDKILDMAEKMSIKSINQEANITFVNGVPGCGKTTWVIKNFNFQKDVVVTTTIAAAKDLCEKLSSRSGFSVKSRVQTLASLLVNGLRIPVDDCNRLIVDEALMNHFGSIVMASRIAEVEEILLIGDINQLPYIDRENLFPIQYHRPTHITVSEDLLCTHRNPMDVSFALKEIYNGIYSSKRQVRSLQLKSFAGSIIPKDNPNTLYLVYTQAEKRHLSKEGFGKGTDSRVMTIHEAQGMTFSDVIIVNRAETKIKLHDSISHAVVAISRHTNSCTYFTNQADDAIGMFIKKAERTIEKIIKDHNMKMAIKNRDKAVMNAMVEVSDYPDYRVS